MSRSPMICNPDCVNGGSCLQSRDGPVCACPSPYTGDSCEINTADRTTYITIAVLLATGLLLTIIIYSYKYCKGERRQTQPRQNRIVQRIISVHSVNSSIKIDKANDDVPPNYDDVTRTTDDQFDDTAFVEVTSELPKNTEPSNHANPMLTEESIDENQEEHSNVFKVQESEEQFISEENHKIPQAIPPSYSLVHKNRASHKQSSADETGDASFNTLD